MCKHIISYWWTTIVSRKTLLTVTVITTIKLFIINKTQQKQIFNLMKPANNQWKLMKTYDKPSNQPLNTYENKRNTYANRWNKHENLCKPMKHIWKTNNNLWTHIWKSTKHIWKSMKHIWKSMKHKSKPMNSQPYYEQHLNNK